jgi:hypothetical protein
MSKKKLNDIKKKCHLNAYPDFLNFAKKRGREGAYVSDKKR